MTTYRPPSQSQHERAVEHRDLSLDALHRHRVFVALVHALLAIEARIEELTTCLPG